ncbi:nucleoporin [Thalictrum thalictroides]|uniref:Nucleoporin n=1 Tax=Thalictrum thalictroides TaxID=46969 RepID=A0A7J6WBC6_THATH|nr:nucleoporin [Thalictrum thalictroides]
MCEANKSKQIPSEIWDVCLMLLQILDKSLHLEFCVAQSCGIRPVLGHLEDFSKEFKLLLQAAEEHISGNLVDEVLRADDIICVPWHAADGWLHAINSCITRFSTYM